MKPLSSRLSTLFAFIETQPLTYPLFSAAFLSLLTARILLENWLFGFKARSALLFWYEFSHLSLFFLSAFLIFFLLLRQIIPEVTRRANILLFGFLVILLPPIIDFWLSGGSGFWSFYSFDSLSGLFHRYITFFGDRPDFGITYGVRSEVAIVTLFLTLFVFIKTKRAIQTSLFAILSYTTLFCLGTFPSWVSYAVLGHSSGIISIRDTDIAALFLSPTHLFFQSSPGLQLALSLKMGLVYASLLPFLIGIILFFTWKSIFLALFQNVRWPQVLYHGGLFIIGIGLGTLLSGAPLSFSFFEILATWVSLIAVIAAWITSVIVNDFFDESIDRETNSERPLPTGSISHGHYRAIGITFFVFSLFLAAIPNFLGAFFLLAYQGVAWIYSAPPFRLKRFPIIATSVSAIASFLVLMVGFSLSAKPESLSNIPLSLIFLLLLAYTLALPLKDFKDIEGDRKAHVWTIPVLFGVFRSKLIIGSGIFLSFLASAFFLKSPTLFIPSLLTGSASFWIILSMRERHGAIHARNIFWWILALTALYGLYAVTVVL